MYEGMRELEKCNRNSNNTNHDVEAQGYSPHQHNFMTTAYIVKHCNKWQHVLGRRQQSLSNVRDYAVSSDFDSPVTSHGNSFHGNNLQDMADEDSEQELSDYNEMEMTSGPPRYADAKNYSIPANVLMSSQPQDLYKNEYNEPFNHEQNYHYRQTGIPVVYNSRSDHLLEKQYFDKWSHMGDNRKNLQHGKLVQMNSVYEETNSCSSEINSVIQSDIGNEIKYPNTHHASKLENYLVRKSDAKKSKRNRQTRRYSRRSRKYSKETADYKRGHITDNLCSALVTTFFCCLPLGVVSLYYTFKVRKSLENSKYEEARKYSQRSRKLSTTGSMIGITAVAACLLILIVRDNVPYTSVDYSYTYPDYIGG